MGGEFSAQIKMSGPELALGGVPVAIALLQTCFRGYEMFTQARQIGEGSQTLLWKFKIQQTRLHMWAKEWGMLDESRQRRQRPGDPDDYKIITETLFRISNLIADYQVLQNRYGLSLVTEDPIFAIQRTEGRVEDVIAEEFNTFLQQDLTLRRDRSKTSNIVKKFRWVAADKGKFESVIKDLTDYNDGLYHLLATAERRALRQGLGAELVTTSNVNELLGLEAAADSASYEDLSQTSVLRRHLVTSDLVNTSLELRVSGDSIALCEPPNATSGHLGRALARQTFGNTQNLVIVEWKHFDRDAEDHVRRSQLNRLDALARLLHLSCKPKALRVPNCLGYFCDDWHPRVGLLFEYPGGSAQQATPSFLSLHELLLNSKSVPFLGDRFRLALDLSLSLGRLHTSGWLHKGIRSDNIIFIQGSQLDNGESPPSLTQPLVLGFEYSRQDSPFAETDLVVSAREVHNLYRHPKSIAISRDRYCRAFDIYSLGIVLLEIGFWRPISEFWTEGQSLNSFTEDLTDFYVPNLGAKAGKIYMEAVRSCLTGELADINMNDTGSQKGFYWEVVRELARLVA